MLMTRTSKNTFAVLLVAVFVANWLVTPFLFARHEHVWCIEHQRFEHVHHHHPTNDNHNLGDTIWKTGVGFSRPVAGYETSLQSHSDRFSEPHDVCTVLAQLIQTSNAMSCPTDCERIDVSDESVGTVQKPVFLFVSQLSLAPKNSPPSV